MLKYKTYIIEDERHNREILIGLINQYFIDSLEVVGVSSSILESTEFLKHHKADILLLDIELRDGQVFELLNNIDYRNYKLIFVTGYSEHAIKAFKYAAVDYLLKPINKKEFAVAISNAKAQLTKENPILDDYIKRKQFDVADYLVINTAKAIEKIPIESISHLEADGVYTTIYYDSKSTITSKPLGVYEDVLPRMQFNRCHKSYIVNRSYIKRIGKGRGLDLTLFDGKELPVAVRKKEEFMHWFEDL